MRLVASDLFPISDRGCSLKQMITLFVQLYYYKHTHLIFTHNSASQNTVPLPFMFLFLCMPDTSSKMLYQH